MAKRKEKIDQYKTGDRCFAKVKGYSPWPAQIQRREKGKEERYLVHFYGSHEIAVVKVQHIYAYDERNIGLYGKSAKKSPLLEKAMAEIGTGVDLYSKSEASGGAVEDLEKSRDEPEAEHGGPGEASPGAGADLEKTSDVDDAKAAEIDQDKDAPAVSPQSKPSSESSDTDLPATPGPSSQIKVELSPDIGYMTTPVRNRGRKRKTDKAAKSDGGSGAELAGKTSEQTLVEKVEEEAKQTAPKRTRSLRSNGGDASTSPTSEQSSNQIKTRSKESSKSAEGSPVTLPSTTSVEPAPVVSSEGETDPVNEKVVKDDSGSDESEVVTSHVSTETMDQQDTADSSTDISVEKIRLELDLSTAKDLLKIMQNYSGLVSLLAAAVEEKESQMQSRKD